MGGPKTKKADFGKHAVASNPAPAHYSALIAIGFVGAISDASNNYRVMAISTVRIGIRERSSYVIGNREGRLGT